MRHGFRLAAYAALATIVLTSCSDRPNDLDTYYDDPPTPVEHAEHAEHKATPAPRSTKPAPKTAAPVPSAAQVDTALLRDDELAAEGVLREPGAAPAPTGCLSTISANGTRPAGTPGAETPGRSAAWRYPTGSRLQHYVRALTVPAATTIRSANCAAEQVSMPAPPGVEANRAWCEPITTGGATCTVLLGRGHLRSALQVTAADPVRAREAVVRLAPLVAGALTRA